MKTAINNTYKALHPVHGVSWVLHKPLSLTIVIIAGDAWSPMHGA